MGTLGRTFFWNRIFVFVVAAAMLSSMAYAAQPALPTTVIGLVAFENGDVAENVQVIALWTDTENRQRSSTTLTLTQADAVAAGDLQFTGYYLFNKGDIQAQSNTDIQLLINGFTFKSVTANPGSVVTVQDAVLSAAVGAQGGSGAEDSDGSAARAGSSSGSSSGTSIGTSEEGEAGSGGGSGASANQGTETDPSNTGSGSSGSGSGDSTATPNSAQFDADAFVDNDQLSPTQYEQATKEPPLPSNLYGQLLDEAGRPVGGEKILVEYTDIEGDTYVLETETISAEDAERLGDPTLEGYYFFNDGNIQADPGSEIRVRTEAVFNYEDVESKPGHLTKVESLVLLAAPAPRINDEGVVPATQGTRRSFSLDLEPSETTIQIFGIFITLAIIGYAAFFFYARHKNKDAMQRFSLYKKINLVLGRRVASIMTKKPVTITAEDTLHKALEEMIEHECHTLIVVDGAHPVGILSYDDILFFPYSAELFDTLHVKDRMNARIVMAPHSLRIERSAELFRKYNLDTIPVTKNGELVGTLLVDSVLRYFKGFFNTNEIEGGSLPIIRSLVTKRFSISPEENKLKNIYQTLVKNKQSVCMISKNPGAALLTKNIVGIVTRTNLVQEIYKNPFIVEKLNVSQTMQTNVTYMPSNVDIVRANEQMILNHHLEMPVIEDNEVIGVLNARDLLKSIHQFVADTKKQLASKKGAADEKKKSE